MAKQLVCGWKLIAARLGFPDVTDFLAQRLAVSIVAARESVPKTATIYGDLQQHRSSWRLRETSKTILDMQDSWRQDSEPFYRRGLRFCGDKDRQRRVYCHVIEEAAKLAVGPGTTCAEDGGRHLLWVEQRSENRRQVFAFVSDRFGEPVLGAAAFASQPPSKARHGVSLFAASRKPLPSPANRSS